MSFVGSFVGKEERELDMEELLAVWNARNRVARSKLVGRVKECVDVE